MARVLLIESDKLFANNLAAVFKTAGHKLDWQRDPQSAINSIDRNLPDVIIMDLLLAGRSGVEFLNEFRSYPEWRQLPVIIYSEVQPDEFSLSGGFSEFGVKAYHYKPQTGMSELLSSVDSVLASVAV